MPVISTFQSGRIEERVPGARLDTSGAGAVAQALAGVGAVGEKIATDLLMERKIAQANEYERDSVNKKTMERKNVSRDLSNRMDKSTGRIIEGQDEQGNNILSAPDDTFYSRMETWERDTDDRILLDAPTDLAAEKFKTKEGVNNRQALLAYDKFQNETIKENQVLNLAEDGEDRSKAVQSHDASVPGSSSTTQFAIEQIEDTEMAYQQSNRLNELEKAKFTKDANKKIANSAVWNNITAGNLNEAGKNLDLGRMLGDDAFKGKAKALLEKLYKKKYDDIGVSKLDGSIFGITKHPVGEGNPDTVIMTRWNEKEGKFEEQEIAKTDVQVGGGPIDIEGKAPDNKILENLSTADQRKWGNQLLKKMEQKHNESNNRLKANHKGLTSSLEKTGQGSIRPDFSDSTDPSTELFRNHLNEIKNSTLDDTVKDRMVVDLFSSYMRGEVKESMDWDTEGQALNRAEGSFDAITKVMEQEGFEELASDPVFGNDLRTATQNTSKNYAVERNKMINKAAYTVNKDAKARKYQGEMDTSPEAYKRYKNYIGSRFDQMGVAPGQRKNFTDEYLSAKKGELEGMLEVSAGESGQMAAADWMFQQKMNKGSDFVDFMEQLEGEGLDSSLKAAALMKNDAIGRKATKLLINAYVNRKAITSAYNTRTKEGGDAFLPEDKLEGLVSEKLGDLTNYMSRRSNVSADLKNMQDVLKGVKLVAMDNALRFNGSKDKAAINTAVNDLFFNTSTVAKSGSNLIVWNKGELDVLGLNEGQANAITKYYSEPKSIMDKVDIRASLPKNIIDQLSSLKQTPEQEEAILKEWFTNGDLGRLTPDKQSDRLTFHMERDGRRYHLIGKDGKQLTLAIEEAKNDKGFQELSGSVWFNFFGKGNIGNVK